VADLNEFGGLACDGASDPRRVFSPTSQSQRLPEGPGL